LTLCHAHTSDMDTRWRTWRCQLQS
jgi:hypothetical protein